MDEIKLPEPAFKVTKTGRVFSHPDEVDCTGRALDVYTADQLREAVEADRAQIEPNTREMFNAGWCAAARFCDREDVVYDGLVGSGGCPAFEDAYRDALTSLSAAPRKEPSDSAKHQEQPQQVHKVIDWLMSNPMTIAVLVVIVTIAFAAIV